MWECLDRKFRQSFMLVDIVMNEVRKIHINDGDSKNSIQLVYFFMDFILELKKAHVLA